MLKYFLQYEFIFLFTIPKMLKTKQRVCLLLSGYMQKVKKPMDLCMKKALAKFSCKSKSFATLAEDLNICIIWKTSATSKSCSLQQNSLTKAFLIGKDRENTVNNMGVVKKGCTNMCAPAIVNLYKQTKVDLFFNMEETLSYGRQTLANFQKIFSMSTELITVSPPRFVPLTL